MQSHIDATITESNVVVETIFGNTEETINHLQDRIGDEIDGLAARVQSLEAQQG